MMNFEQYLEMSGFSRLRSIMLGDVPHINQFAILTAQNPGAEKTSDKENKKRNKDLTNDLRTASFKPVTIRKGKEQQALGLISLKGKFFGIEEDSFFIPHMDRELALHYGKKYEQEAVIFASKHEDENGNPYFRFEYINVDKGNTESTRIVSVATLDVQSRDDMFSQKGGFIGSPKELKKDKTHATSRKFIVPFFDDKYAYYKPGKKFGTISPPEILDLPPEEQEKLLQNFGGKRKADYDGTLRTNTEFYIPFVDEVIDGIMPLVDGHVPEYAFFSSDLPDTLEVKQLVKEIREYEEGLLNENRNQKGHYHNRSLMMVRLEKLSEIVKGHRI